MKVLLLKLKKLDRWALPGGFVAEGQDVDKEAARVLKNRTGLENIFLHQFYLFGDVSRSDSKHIQEMVREKVLDQEEYLWFQQRFVTVGYYALVEYSKVQEPTPDHISELCEWCPLQQLPELILDHRQIIDRAHQTLKKELNNQPVGLNLLPDQFTMPELQALYETLLEKELDRRNFRRKMLSFDILIATNKRRRGGAHKAPMLYEFDKEKYERAMQAGLSSGW